MNLDLFIPDRLRFPGEIQLVRNHEHPPLRGQGQEDQNEARRRHGEFTSTRDDVP